MIGLPVIWNSLQFSGGGGGFSFTTFQTDFGTSPVADSSSDTITFTSSDSAFEITGDSSSDQIDFTLGTGIASYLTGASVFMFSGTNSDISGYESAPTINSFTAGATQSIAQTVTTTPTLLEEFATASGVPNVTAIPPGLIGIHYETQKTSGGQSYYTYAEVYKRTTGGTETLIATSDNSSSTSVNTLVQTTVTAFLSSITTLNTTDRLVVKIYAVMSSSSATITLYWDNNTNARLQVPTYSTGINTGDVTLAAIGSTPNANGATITGQVLNLQPASISFGGVVSVTTQSFLGAKTFQAATTADANVSAQGITSQFGNLFLAVMPASGFIGHAYALRNSSGTTLAALNKDGQFLGQVGSASLPSFAFMSAAGSPLVTSGIFQAASNSVSVSANSVEIARFNSIGQLTLGGNLSDTDAQLQVNTNATGKIGLILKNIASQTANVLQIRESDNAVKAGMSEDFRSFWGMAAPLVNTQNAFSALVASNTVLGLRGIASQAGPYILIEDSSPTTVFLLSATGNLQAVVGSASTPTYGYNDDPTTGTYLKATGVYGISTSGTERITVDENGNIRCYTNHNNATIYGIETEPEIRSGTIDLSVGTLTNVNAFTIYKCTWQRVSNSVIMSFSGTITVDSTSTNTSVVIGGLPCPPANNFVDQYGAHGDGTILIDGALITAVASAQEILLEWFPTFSGDGRFSFTAHWEVV